MKKIFFFATVVMLLFSACSVYKEVEVKEVLDVQIIEFNERGAVCEIFLTVFNPNGYKISLTESHVDLFFEGKPLGEVVLIDQIDIPKRSQSTIKMKCEAGIENVQALMGNVLTLLFKNEYVLEGNGYIRGKAMLVSKKVPVTFKENLSKDDLGF